MTLRYKEEEPIDVVEWCSTSVLAHEEARASLTREREKVTKLEKEVEDLQTQLNEFIEAKKAHEAGLMEKFRDLLNEKKVKIREQQRLLANAPRAPRSPQEEREVAATEGRSPDIKIEEDARGHKPVPSRRSKRKTVTPKEESSDDDFEKMEVDEEKEAPARDSENDRTTEAASDEDVTASEDDDGELPTTRAAASQSTEPRGDEAPPPKRELPFATKKNTRAKPPPKAVGSETESDDEL